jgi:hypothetical protein
MAHNARSGSDAGSGRGPRLRYPLGLVTCLVLGACGGGSGTSAGSDARPVDGPIFTPIRDAAVDAPLTPSISVNRSGFGSVTSEPAGIDCGISCLTFFDAGTQVTLTATPALGATFTGWTGACSGTGACVVTVEGPVVVGATFEGGCVDECVAGTGQCLSATSQRTCGEFDTDPCLDWSPPTDCTGSEVCSLGRCGAEHQLGVLPLFEDAFGTVTSSPAGITCGLDGRQCQHSYPDGAQVTLTATSSSTAVFAGWVLLPFADTNAMACVGSLAPCTVTMSQVTSLAATYCTPECPIGGVRCSGETNVIETCGEHDSDPCTEFGPPITCGGGLLCTRAGCRAGFVVTATAEGDGAVAIDSVTCKTPPCTQGVATGGSARITAIPGPASAFTSWSGACTGSGPCTVTGTGTVTAHFADRCVETPVLNMGGGPIEGSSVAIGNELFVAEDFNLNALFHGPLGGDSAELATFAGAPMWNLTADSSGPYWLEGFSLEFELMHYVDGATQSLVQHLTDTPIALGATDVFFQQRAHLMKVAKTGGTPVTVATLPDVFYASIVVDASSIYWVGDSVLKFPIGGGPATTLVAASGVGFFGLNGAVSQDGTYLYWARNEPVPSAIVRVPKAGGPVETVVAARDVVATAVRGTTLAWISANQPPQATTIGSGAVIQLGRSLANDRHPGIAIDAGAVYVTSSSSDIPSLSPVIIRMARSATCVP